MNRAHALTRDGAPLAEVLQWREREPSEAERRANELAAAKERKTAQHVVRKQAAGNSTAVPAAAAGPGNVRQFSTAVIRPAQAQSDVASESEPAEENAADVIQKQVDLQLQGLSLKETENNNDTTVLGHVQGAESARAPANEGLQSANGNAVPVSAPIVTAGKGDKVQEVDGKPVYQR